MKGQKIDRRRRNRSNRVDLNVLVPLSSMLINSQPSRRREVGVPGGDHRHQQSRYTSQQAPSAVIPSLS